MPTALRNACGLALQVPDAATVNRAMCDRHDLRHLSGGPVDDAVLPRLLCAAHHAPIAEQERLMTVKALAEHEDDS